MRRVRPAQATDRTCRSGVWNIIGNGLSCAPACRRPQGNRGQISTMSENLRAIEAQATIHHRTCWGCN